MPPIEGSCLCGAVRYRVNADITELRACHCTSCQKISGSGGTVNAIVASKDFTLLQGTPRRYAAKADSGRILNRYFCGDCGSGLYSQREISPERMVLRAGAIDNAPPMKLTAHIWTRSKRPWSHIDPATTQLPGNPD